MEYRKHFAKLDEIIGRLQSPLKFSKSTEPRRKKAKGKDILRKIRLLKPDTKHVLLKPNRRGFTISTVA